MQKQSQRLIEIDVLRGLAVLGMMVYHEMYILVYIFTGSLWLPAPAARFFGLLVALTFLFVLGLSAQLKFDRLSLAGIQPLKIYASFAKRGVELGLAALLVSGVTWLIIPTFFIRFGILHLMALTLFLLPFFLGSKQKLLAGIGLTTGLWLVLGSWRPEVNTYLLLPFDLMPSGYQALDHWPLLPNLVLPLTGALVGMYAYPKGQRSFSIPLNLHHQIYKPLVWLGQHALFMYLVHAPILFVCTWMLAQW